MLRFANARKRSELLEIPNVGNATMGDLHRLGITIIAQLKNKNPEQIYDSLCTLDGVAHDICCVDVFTAAIAFANTGRCEDWWYYSNLRKQKTTSAQ